MKTNVQIWYMKPEWFRNGSAGKRPDPAKLSETHVHLKDVPLETKDDALSGWDLEKVWTEMQGENWSPNGEARELIRSKGLSHTSMSIGDVAMIDGRAHLVGVCGWKGL